MNIDYELTRFDITRDGEKIGQVEKQCIGSLGMQWVALVKLNDGTLSGCPITGTGKTPEEAILNTWSSNRNKFSCMLRELEHLESCSGVPILAELATIE